MMVGLIFGVIGIILIGINWGNKHLVRIPTSGGKYIEGVNNYPRLINPLYAPANPTDADLVALIYSGLMKFDPKLGLATDLVESFSLSKEETTYTFTLKPDLRWSDGEPLTTKDVVFTLQAIQNPEYLSVLNQRLSRVSIERIDDLNFTLTIPEPYAPLIAELTFGILPAHLWEDLPPSSAQISELNLKPIGSGPYKFLAITKDNKGFIKSYRLRANLEYYGTSPLLEEVEFKFFPSPIELREAILNKTINGTGYLDQEGVAWLQNQGFKGLNNWSTNQFLGLFFNLKKTGSPWLSLNMRNALGVVVDRSALNQAIYQGRGVMISSAHLLQQSGTAVIGPNEWAQAKANLETEGWGLAEGEVIRKKAGVELALTITTIDLSAEHQASLLLCEQFKLLGVKCEVNKVPRNALSSLLKSRDYEGLLVGEKYGAVMDPYLFWHSSAIDNNGYNLSQLVDPTVDKLVNLIRTSGDGGARAQAWEELSAQLLNLNPAIFLLQTPFTYVMSPKVEGVEVGLINNLFDRFQGIEQWYNSKRWSIK